MKNLCRAAFAAAVACLLSSSALAADVGSSISPANNGFSANVTNSATAADSNPGTLYGWYIGNTNTSNCYLQIFNLATGSVSLGSTAPKFSFLIPASSSSSGGANALSSMGIQFSTAITVAATTTRTGSTACTNGLDLNLFIQ